MNSLPPPAPPQPQRDWTSTMTAVAVGVAVGVVGLVVAAVILSAELHDAAKEWTTLLVGAAIALVVFGLVELSNLRRRQH